LVRNWSLVQSFSLSIHSRMYAGQFFSFMPFASQFAKNFTEARSARRICCKSRTMFRGFFCSSTICANSPRCPTSIRPLKLKTMRSSSSDVSIFKVIREKVADDISILEMQLQHMSQLCKRRCCNTESMEYGL